MYAVRWHSGSHSTCLRGLILGAQEHHQRVDAVVFRNGLDVGLRVVCEMNQHRRRKLLRLHRRLAAAMPVGAEGRTTLVAHFILCAADVCAAIVQVRKVNY